jgi:dephospho-CoA kinase
MSETESARPPLVVGLTGGVASGKSVVAGMFGRFGTTVIDTDVIAREVVALGEPGLSAVTDEFGTEVLLPSGELNRPALRKRIFADESARRRLESLLHPLIHTRTRARLAQVATPYAIVAVPLLVETQFDALVDRVLVVDSPKSLQLERLMQRDAIPREEALAMIRAQADRVTRLRTADDVIDNSGSLESTRHQVEQLHRRYLELAALRRRRI